MGNSEVGHLNLGAGAVVKQDLTRIDDAIADGSFFENPALLAACEAARRRRAGGFTCSAWSPTAASTRLEHIDACVELARARGRAASSCTRSSTGATRRRGRRRLPARARELAAPGAGASARSPGATGHGPRQALGARRKGVSTRSSTARASAAPSAAAAIERRYAARRDRRVRQADRDRRLRRRSRDGDAVLLLQLPARPRARSSPGRSASPTSTGSTRRAPPCSTLVTHDRVRRRAGPARWRSRRRVPETTSGRGARRAAAAQFRIAETEKYAHVTYFFNGGREEPFAGEERTWCRRRRTSPPTTSKPEMSAAAAADESCEAVERRLPTSSSSTSRTPTWSGTPGVDPGGDHGRRGRRRVPRAHRRGGRTKRAARCSSPPTTATRRR